MRNIGVVIVSSLAEIFMHTLSGFESSSKLSAICIDLAFRARILLDNKTRFPKECLLGFGFISRLM